MLNDIYKDANSRMRGAVQALEEDLAGASAASVSAAAADPIRCEGGV